MKTNMKLLGVMLVAGALMMVAEANAQGRGNGRGNHKNKHDHKHDRDWNRFDHNLHREWRGPSHDRHERRYVYHRPPHWAPAHGYRNQVRYVYYRDYNVYYDCYRGVYITLSGRNWVYSQHMPVPMRRARLDRVVYVDLDYYDDDLPYYLERRRSGSFASIHARF